MQFAVLTLSYLNRAPATVIRTLAQFREIQICLSQVLQRTEQAEAEDLWLRRLLAYHSREAGCAGWGAAEPAEPAQPEKRAATAAAADFDGLRLSHRSAALPEVERRIREEL